MFPVVIELIHLQGINRTRFIERAFYNSSLFGGDSSTESGFFLKLNAIKKLYDIGEFKSSKQEKDRIVIVCSNPYYQVEISPDYSYGCNRYTDLKCILRSTKILCDIAIYGCLFVDCDRCKKHGGVHFDSERHIDLNALPEGWSRVKYKTLCKECSEDFDRVFSEFMEDKNETS